MYKINDYTSNVSMIVVVVVVIILKMMMIMMIIIIVGKNGLNAATDSLSIEWIEISRKKQKAIEGFMRTRAESIANKGEEKDGKKIQY